jgi:hypothetical protein
MGTASSRAPSSYGRGVLQSAFLIWKVRCGVEFGFLSSSKKRAVAEE